MKKKNLTFFIIVFILIVGFSLYHFNNTLYGNDKESIVKVIKSIEGYDDKSIEILEIKDFNNVRVVGFLFDGKPAYIEFNKNSMGNYKWRSIEVRNDETLSSFFPILPNNIRPKLMFVSSYGNKVAKILVDVNGHIVEQKFPPNNPSVTWVDLPQSNKSDYTFRNYKFFNEEGKLIQDLRD